MLKTLIGLAVISISICVNGNASFSHDNKAITDANPFARCGSVIAHEDGPFNFLPLKYCHGVNTCPQQLVAMQNYNATAPNDQQLKFTKISIRTLSDGTWVVAHDDDQYILSLSNKADANALQKSHSDKSLTLMSVEPVAKNASYIAVYKTKYYDPRKIKHIKEFLGDKISIKNNYVLRPVNDIEHNLRAPKHSNLELIGILPINDNQLQQSPNLGIQKIELSKIDSKTYDDLKNKYKDKFDVYRLADYTKVNASKDLCMMLYFKTDPNKNILTSINDLGFNDTILLESRNNDDATWLQQNQQGLQSIYYTGRVRNQAALDDLISKKADYPNMKMIEVSGLDPKNIPATKQLVANIKAAGFLSEVDSMDYSKEVVAEMFKTACLIPLKQILSTNSMTSRPINCLKELSKN